MFKNFFTGKIRKLPLIFNYIYLIFIRHWNALAWVIMDLAVILIDKIFLGRNVKRNIENSSFSYFHCIFSDCYKMIWFEKTISIICLEFFWVMTKKIAGKLWKHTCIQKGGKKCLRVQAVHQMRLLLLNFPLQIVKPSIDIQVQMISIAVFSNTKNKLALR